MVFDKYTVVTTPTGVLSAILGACFLGVTISFFLTGTTVFESVPLSPAFTHVLSGAVGMELLGNGITIFREPPEDDSPEPIQYGYHDQWEQENL
jgi:hypothetical protein